ncbi:hypothetical protein RB595_002787 [Gaeumannomyces hyphopodioides]
MPVDPTRPAELPAAEQHSGPQLQPRRSISSAMLMQDSMTSSLSGATGRSGLREKLRVAGFARRTLGIILLIITVFLWTLSNFLTSYIFSDNTYSKPFFVVYINTSFFAVSLIPMALKYVREHGTDGFRNAAVELWREQKRRGLRPGAPSSGLHSKLQAEGEDAGEAGERLLLDDEGSLAGFDVAGGGGAPPERLDFRETAWLSLEFCMLWFLANYFASACLEYTSVGSVTILTSTSSVWTLILCAVMRVESFTVRKLCGVLAGLAGVVLISTVDLSGKSDESRGNFPHKSTGEMAIGDSMAFVSAIIYGLYITVMKRRVGNEDHVNMPLFFGLVGLLNLILLWPVFFILHFTGIETFALPPSGKIWGIILLNSLSSFVSDMSWAYAMLLTTPLVVTMGLSLTIPLSLVGEMIQYHQYSSWVYWVGACVVLLSFVFINHESHDDEDPRNRHHGMTEQGSTV